MSKTFLQNMDLIQDARAARAYRDELDILKDKVITDALWLYLKWIGGLTTYFLR